MPNNVLDYSNTIFYKIYCVNPDITELYIGHTTNFVQRKQSHKQSSTTANCQSNNCKLYKYIRNHGGWDNWKMEIIAFHNCEDHYSARKHEQEYYNEYNATLNSIEPFPPPKIKKDIIKKAKTEQLYCNTCNVYFVTIALYETHNKTNKHMKRLTMEQTTERKLFKFQCEKCNFLSSNKKDYNKHLSTAKHNMEIIGNNIITYKCNKCEQIYKTNSGLWKHNQKCNSQNQEFKQLMVEPQSAIIDIQKQNQEFKQLIIEQQSAIIDIQKQNQEFKQLMVEQHAENIELHKQLVNVVNDGTVVNNTTNLISE